MRERRRASHIAKTMHCSGEVPGDIIGWWSNRERKEPPYNIEPAFAFIPVVKGQVAGFVIVRKREAFAFARRGGKFEPVESNPQLHWCIEKIWIYETYRRKAIASYTIRSIAQYFQEDTESMGWLGPFTNNGSSLVFSLSGKIIFVAG